MISDLQSLLTVVAAVGSGLIAGTFFAFSAFVMRALERLPTPHGVAANPEAARCWPESVSRWTLWNHLRTAPSLAATVCFIAALREP